MYSVVHCSNLTEFSCRNCTNCSIPSLRHVHSSLSINHISFSSQTNQVTSMDKMLQLMVAFLLLTQLFLVDGLNTWDNTTFWHIPKSDLTS